MTTFESIREKVLAHEYDPVKAHEYYLRTRELKGRKPGPTEVLTKDSSSTDRALPGSGTRRSTAVTSVITKDSTGKPLTTERLDELKAKLEKLRGILRELVQQAKERSGIDTEKNAKSEAGKSSDKPLTAQQKKEAAQRSKDYYEKNVQQTPPEQEKALTDQIRNIEDRIKKMRAQLEAVKPKVQERTAGSVGVGNRSNRLKKGDSQNGS